MSTWQTPTLTQLQWLRNILDDNGSPEVEVSTATGEQVEFFVAAPPISSVSVYVNSVVVSPSAYTVPDTNDEVIFNTPPAFEDTVTIRYTRQTWPDAELNNYIAEAQSEYTKDRHVVYRAAIFAIDTLQLGMRLAFDFGAGDENYSFSRTAEGVAQLRDDLEKWLIANAEEGVLLIDQIRFDSIEPGDLRDDPAQWPYSGNAGIFPADGSEGGIGGLDG
jgi:hypothetical protein